MPVFCEDCVARPCTGECEGHKRPQNVLRSPKGIRGPKTDQDASSEAIRGQVKQKRPIGWSEKVCCGSRGPNHRKECTEPKDSKLPEFKKVIAIPRDTVPAGEGKVYRCIDCRLRIRDKREYYELTDPCLGCDGNIFVQV